MLDTHEIAALGARRLKETADKDGDRVLDAGRASRNTELVARNLEVRRSPRPVRRSDRSSWLLHAARERERDGFRIPGSNSTRSPHPFVRSFHCSSWLLYGGSTRRERARAD